MSIVSIILIILVAVIHGYILWLEMFAWTTRGPKVFSSLKPELFEPTKVLAANQGLYNGFLVAGLIWALLISTPAWATNVAIFFLLCVTVAGIYGANTASRRIFYVQSIPALAALGSLFI